MKTDKNKTKFKALLSTNYPLSTKRQSFNSITFNENSCQRKNFEMRENINCLIEEISKKTQIIDKNQLKIKELQTYNSYLLEKTQKSKENDQIIEELKSQLFKSKNLQEKYLEELENQKKINKNLLNKINNYQEESIKEKEKLREYYNNYFSNKQNEENLKNLEKIRILESENKKLKALENNSRIAVIRESNSRIPVHESNSYLNLRRNSEKPILIENEELMNEIRRLRLDLNRINNKNNLK